MTDYPRRTMTPRDASLARTHAEHTLRRASETLGTGISHIQDDVAAFYTAADNLDAAIARTAADRELSPEGKQRRHAAHLQAFADATAGIPDTIQREVGTLARRLEARAAPTPLDTDPHVNEARLQTARLDARMLLDARKDAHGLPKYMAKLAQREPGAMQHLLLGTRWGHQYLESRNASAAIVDWDSQHRALRGLVLTEDGRRAHKAHEALRPLGNVAAMLQQQRDHTIRSRR